MSCTRYVALCTFVLLLFKAANIPETANLDIANYRADYEGSYNRYEVGYEFIVQMMNQKLDVTFERFWMLIIGAQIVIFLYAYNLHGALGGLLGFPVLLSLAGSTIGMQVRYGLSCALFLLGIVCLVRSRRILATTLVAAACLLHNATILITLLCWLILILAYAHNKWKIGWPVLFTLYGTVLYFITSNIEALLSTGRYVSYFGTVYFATKSTTSIVYTIIMLAGISFLLTRKQARLNVEIMMHIGLLIAVLCLSGYAVISGRLLVMTFFLEPVTIISLLDTRKPVHRLVIMLPLILLSWSKVVLMT